VANNTVQPAVHIPQPYAHPWSQAELLLALGSRLL